jgi:hypothetical protein
MDLKKSIDVGIASAASYKASNYKEKEAAAPVAPQMVEIDLDAKSNISIGVPV